MITFFLFGIWFVIATLLANIIITMIMVLFGIPVTFGPWMYTRERGWVKFNSEGNRVNDHR